MAGSSTDTEIEGTGMVQIIGSNGTTIAKSKTIKTTVGTIVPGSEEAEAPKLYQNTIDELLAAMAVIQNATEDARDDALDAQTDAEYAASLANAAKLSTNALIGIKETVPLEIPIEGEAIAVNMDSRPADFAPTLAVIGENLTRVAFYYNGTGKIFTFDAPGVSACLYDGFSGATSEISVEVAASTAQTATFVIATGMKADVVAAQAYSLLCKDYASLTDDSDE